MNHVLQTDNKLSETNIDIGIETDSDIGIETGLEIVHRSGSRATSKTSYGLSLDAGLKIAYKSSSEIFFGLTLISTMWKKQT